MHANTLELRDQADGAIGSHGRWGRWGRMVRALASRGAILRSRVARHGLCQDARYLAAAHSLEDLERRQRRLERDGNPLAGSFLP